MEPTTLQLTDEQRTAVHRSACALVAGSVVGMPLRADDAIYHGCGNLAVHGAFVTLRKQGELRACCGCIGETKRLADALAEAAEATALRDTRFPPIVRRELVDLDVSISLLHSLKLLEADADARQAGIVVGRHGLQMEHGRKRGLLLPQVATDHGLDVEQFLVQTCKKADLPPEAWKSPDTHIWTFEGLVFGGPFNRGCVP